MKTTQQWDGYQYGAHGTQTINGSEPKNNHPEVKPPILHISQWTSNGPCAILETISWSNIWDEQKKNIIRS